MAEYFLMFWAFVATLVAVLYQTKAQTFQRMHHIASSVLVGIANGDTTITEDNGGVKFSYTNGDEISEIYIKAREGEDSDSP
jgi:hypothetical protein